MTLCLEDVTPKQILLIDPLPVLFKYWLAIDGVKELPRVYEQVVLSHRLFLLN